MNALELPLMPQNATCPFCDSTRLTITDQTKLLVHYRCGFCFKQWGEARLHRTYEPVAHVHPFPRWVAVDDGEGERGHRGSRHGS